MVGEVVTVVDAGGASSTAKWREDDDEWEASCARARGKLGGMLSTLGLNPPSGLSPSRLGERAPPGTAKTGTTTRRQEAEEEPRERTTPPPPPPPPDRGALEALEARVASQTSANAALRSSLREKESAVSGLESMVSKLRAELRSREAEAAAADRVAVRANPDVEELQRRHREVVSTTVESYEGKLREAKERSQRQSRRSQELLEKIRRLEREAEDRAREEALSAFASRSDQAKLVQMEARLKVHKARCAEEAESCARHKKECERARERLSRQARSEKDARARAEAAEKELSQAKAALSGETAARKRSQAQFQGAAEEAKRARETLDKLKRRFEIHESQREKMVNMIRSLKHVNAELMSALLRERSAGEDGDGARPGSMAEVDNPSLLPRAVRMAREAEGCEPRETPRSGGAAAEPEESREAGVEFYKSLKQRYQEAKATYRSLLARD